MSKTSAAFSPGVKQAPHAAGTWVGGSIGRMRGRGHTFLLELFKEYGDVVRFRLGPVRAMAVRRPEHIRHVLIDNAKNYSKGTRGFLKLQMVLGHGLVTSDGPLWKTQRRLMQPSFHKKRLEQFAHAMVRAGAATVDRWRPAVESGRVIDVAEEMMSTTLDIVNETLLGHGPGDGTHAIAEAVEIIQTDVNGRIMSLWDLPLSWPTPGNRRLRDALAVLDRNVMAVISERRRTGQDSGDLLSMLLHAQDEETGRGMSDQQLRDEVMTIYLAGHETTSNALTWVFHMLSRNPDVERRLFTELQRVLGDEPASLESLPELCLTKRIIYESMRLYPPVWGFSRLADKPDVVGGYHVAPGTSVFISPYAAHRQVEYFQNPEGFDPERFTDAFLQGLPRCAYLPFGAGARQCIGNNFALMEMQLLLATICRSYRLEMEAGHRLTAEPLITLRPAHGLRMHVRAQG
ncbi:MAG: cytochrome P450 [Myxococcota bacterium]|nr:cytochrome P450 [Myxococcota bacterium]